MRKSLDDELCFDERYDLSITNFRKGIYTVGYYAKNAFNKMKRGFGGGACLTAALASIGFASCKLPVPTPEPVPTPKVIELTASPDKGDAPLKSEIHFQGENGTGEINIDEGNDGTIDYTETKSTPSIDFQYFFNKPSTIYAKVISPSGTLDTKSIQVDVETPVNPVENHVPVVSVIPNQEVNEGEQYSCEVTVTDPDGDALTYNVLPTWLKVSDTADSKVKLISGTAPKVSLGTSPADIVNAEFDASDGKAVTKEPYTLTVKNLMDISNDRLEDDENLGVVRQGVARFYDTDTSGTNPLTIKSVTKGTKITDSYGDGVQTDASGGFAVTLNKVVDPTDKIFVQEGTASGTTTISAGTLTSYLRTVDVPAIDENLSESSDVRVKPVTVVPNPTFASREDYKRHIKLTNAPINKIGKFDLDNFQGAEIMRTNRDGTGFFNENIIEKVKNDLAQRFNGNITNGELYINGKLIPVSMVYKEDAHWNNFANRFVYEPYESLSSFGSGVLGSTSRFSKNGDVSFTNGALIRLLSNNTNNHNPLDYVRLHEGDGHGSNLSVGEAYWNNSNRSYNDPLVSSDGKWNGSTVMETDITIPSNPVSLGNADLKTVKIINNPTYVAGENLDNIIRLGWGFSSP